MLAGKQDEVDISHQREKHLNELLESKGGNDKVMFEKLNALEEALREKSEEASAVNAKVNQLKKELEVSKVVLGDTKQEVDEKTKECESLQQSVQERES